MPAKSSGEIITELDPSIIYFTFSRIRPTFSCGRPISQTLSQFTSGELTPNDIPLLCVLQDNAGNYYSQNNRRLFLYKSLKNLGNLTKVPVRLRWVPETKRMKEKYTPAKCAMRATLLREGQINSIQEEKKENIEKEKNDEVEKEEKSYRGSETVEIVISSTLMELNKVNPNNNNKKKKKRKQKEEDDEDYNNNNKKLSGGRVMTLEEELQELGV